MTKPNIIYIFGDQWRAQVETKGVVGDGEGEEKGKGELDGECRHSHPHPLHPCPA